MLLITKIPKGIDYVILFYDTISPVKAVGRAIVMTKGTQAAVNATITIVSPIVGSIVGKQFKTLNIR